MATRFLSRSLFTSPKPTINSFLSRSFTALAVKTSPAQPQSLSLLRLRPLVAIASTFRSAAGSTRTFSTRQTTSSISDPNPNWANRPPKETILLDGCDFEHWLVVVEPPTEEMTRDEIIASYIKTLSQVVGSEQDARMKIYSVSTRHYWAFGALVSEELSYKLKELPNVRWVLPDSYLDVRNKDYGGEPFINGEAVPYDPKYHEEWVRNNARANDRNRRNNRPRDNDRSRNFDRRRGPPPTNQGPPPQNGGYAPSNNMAPNTAPPNNMGGGGGMPPNQQYGGGAQYQPAPGPNANYPPQNRAPPQQNYPPQHGGNSAPYPPQQVNSAPYPPQQVNSAPYPPQQVNSAPYPPQGGYPPNNTGGMPNNAPNPQQYGNAPPPQYGNAPPQQYGQGPYQSGPGPNAPNMYQNQNFPGRD